MNRIVICLCFLVVTSALTRADGARRGDSQSQVAKDAALKVVCTRPSHRYAVGECAEFLVDSPGGVPESVKIRLSLDGEREFASFDTVTPVRVSWSLDEPGFVRCKARGEKSSSEAGAAFDPEKIRPARSRPADYDAFWERAFAELASIPPDFQVRALSETLDLVSCATANGKRQWAFFCHPKDAAPGSCRLDVYVGGGEAYFCEDEGLHEFGKQKGRAKLYIHLPPYEPLTRSRNAGMSAKEYHSKWLKEHGLVRFIYENAEKGGPRDIYLYPCILGSVRLLDWAVRREIVDRKRVLYSGGSHGGGFGLYLASFSPHLTAAFCAVPNFGDLCGLDIGRPIGLSDGPLRKRYAELLPYYDTAYCAERIRCPMFLTCGYIDSSCPPGSVYCAYNAIRAPKRMFDKVEDGHGGTPKGYQQAVDAWMKEQADRGIHRAAGELPKAVSTVVRP